MIQNNGNGSGTMQEALVCLNAEEVSAVLNISRAKAYALMNSEGFPTLRLGGRKVVPRNKLISWVEDQMPPTE